MKHITFFFQSIKDYLSKGNRAQWCLFFLFAFVLFLKICAFHIQYIGGIFISSVYKNPSAFWGFYLPKISICIFIAGFVWITRRYKWVLFFSVVVDFWIFANLLYFRANSLLLDAYSISMAGNMSGFWNCLSVLIQPIDSIFFISSLAFIPFWNFKVKDRRISYSVTCLIFSFVSQTIGLKIQIDNSLHLPIKELSNAPTLLFNPFSPITRQVYLGLGATDSVYNTSIVHLIVYNAVDFIKMSNWNNKIELTEKDKDTILNYFEGHIINTHNENPLIIVVVESFEGWCICDSITPNLCSFLESHATIYAHKLKKQTKHGNSSDGQFILNTGLLPINNGAVCYLYPFNTYPSIINTDVNAVTILPHGKDIWNQQALGTSYGYDTIFVSSPVDTILFSETVRAISCGYKNIQTITLQSHAPFTAGAEYSKLNLPQDMPETMKNYVKSINAMDYGLEVLLKEIDRNIELHNVTFVITGDHPIPNGNASIDDLKKWCKVHKEYNFNLDNFGFTPLIIYSPKIDHNIQITNTCYQMDIYPTIMHLIGCEDYYWKGFGVNLLDSTARKNRQISEDEAYRLSDLLIRSNAFELYKQGKLFDTQTDGKAE